MNDLKNDLEEIKNDLPKQMDDLKNELEVSERSSFFNADNEFQFELESRVVIPANCHEYSIMGSTIDAVYKIQPSLALEPFNVECEFNNGTVNTIVTKQHSQVTGYTSLPQTAGCANDGCFTDEITYNASKAQIQVYYEDI